MQECPTVQAQVQVPATVESGWSPPLLFAREGAGGTEGMLSGPWWISVHYSPAFLSLNERTRCNESTSNRHKAAQAKPRGDPVP